MLLAILWANPLIFRHTQYAAGLATLRIFGEFGLTNGLHPMGSWRGQHSLSQTYTLNMDIVRMLEYEPLNMFMDWVYMVVLVPSILHMDGTYIIYESSTFPSYIFPAITISLTPNLLGFGDSLK